MKDSIFLCHGTSNKKLELNDFFNQIFLSTDVEYSKNRGKNIFSVEIPNNLKLLDSNNVEDLNFLLKVEGLETFYDPYNESEITADDLSVNSDTWETIEYYFLNGVEGFDGIWIYEGGCKNLLLWNYDKIKSIKQIS